MDIRIFYKTIGKKNQQDMLANLFPNSKPMRQHPTSPSTYYIVVVWGGWGWRVISEIVDAYTNIPLIGVLVVHSIDNV